jgi:hypothetical protein
LNAPAVQEFRRDVACVHVAVARVRILRAGLMIEYGQFGVGTASALIDRVVIAIHSTQFHGLKWS